MNILIADDHDIFRQSLALLLENRTQHTVVGHVAEFSSLLSRIEELKPHCILLDYHMPGGDPMETADAINRKHPDVKIIVLTGAQSPAILKQLSQHQFTGLLHKRDSADIILQAIEQVAEGERFLSSSVEDMLGEIEVDLTQREMQVLAQFMEGKSPVNIADELNISIRTVEKHKENMMKKLGVSSSVQLVEAGHRIIVK